MPEGHHLHRLALEVNDRFQGCLVTVTSPQGRFADAASLLDGTRLERAWAVGKHLFIGFADERIVHIHLGLIGKLRFYPNPGGPGQVRLRIATERSGTADLTGPQTCQLIGPVEAAAVIGALGPDPLDPSADPERAWVRIHRSQRPIGALLMDQSVMAGVGNIYRAEVLFRARIDPHAPGARLSHRQVLDLWNDLVELMPLGVRDGRIDTVRPEHTPEAMGRPPRVDAHGGEVYVYRRAGQPCLVCGTVVLAEEMAGRHLYWCRRCQRRLRP